MAGWRNPRAQDIKDPAQRQVWQSLERFLQNPTFPRGVTVGTASDEGAFDASTGQVASIPTVDLDSITVIQAGALIASQFVQSTDWDGGTVAAATDTDGFRLEGGGDAAFNNVRVRGDVVAETFATALDFTVAGGVEVTGTDVKKVNFRNAGTLETDPSNITAGQSFGGSYLGMSGPGSNPPFFGLRTDDTTSETVVSAYSPNGGIDLETLGGDVDIQAVGGAVRAQGVNLVKPPYALFGPAASATALTSGSDTALPAGTTASVDNPILGGGASVTYLGSNQYRPNEAGIWRLTVLASWEPNGSYSYSMGLKRNGGTTTSYMTGEANAAALAPRGQFTAYVQFNGTSDYVTCQMLQTSGGPRDCRIQQLVFEHVTA